jgi:ATP-dependent exoDNAse (exonuclease V) beta subunit
LLSDKECVIVDYKTGAKENEHLKQMQAYKSAYTTYFNKPTTAFLLYTDTVELIEVR